jgi:hypothetical protein
MGDNDVTLLANSKGWVPAATKGPHQSMVTSFRFVNSEIYFDETSLTLLLRILESNSCENREKWWNDVRACRRRRQVSWDMSVPISISFQTQHEIEYVQYGVTVSRIRSALQEKGMLLFDAFRAMNSSSSGFLNCSELFGGLDYLDVPFERNDVYDLVNRLSANGDGLVTYEDFKRTFGGNEEELESRNVGDESTFFETIPPHVIPEINEDDQQGGANSVVLTEDILENFVAKCKPIGELLPIWNSQNTQSRVQVSIWAPSLKSGWGAVAKTRIMLCHYASTGFRNPLKLKGYEQYQSIILSDVATIRLKRAETLASVLRTVFPHPLRFKESWHMKRGAQSLYAWKGVAPEGYACLGNVFTSTDCAPKLNEIRCVPAKWCATSKQAPTKLWDDTGAGGGKPGSLWIINDMNMVVAVTGHDTPPREDCLMLAEHKYFFEGFSANTLMH